MNPTLGSFAAGLFCNHLKGSFWYSLGNNTTIGCRYLYFYLECFEGIGRGPLRRGERPGAPIVPRKIRGIYAGPANIGVLEKNECTNQIPGTVLSKRLCYLVHYVVFDRTGLSA